MRSDGRVAVNVDDEEKLSEEPPRRTFVDCPLPCPKFVFSQ